MILTTLLAENADEILAATCDRIGASFDRSQSWPERLLAVTQNHVDGVWVCGLLGMRMLQSGDLRGSVGAVPVFSGRNKPVYQAVVVARRGSGYASLADVAGAVLAVNDYGSWSGYGALVEHLQSHRRSIDIFSREVETGSHLQSLEAVQHGLADVAAIDHTVWDWAAARGQTEGMVVIDRSSPWPAPPLVAINPEVSERVLGTDLTGIDGIERWVSPAPHDYDIYLDY